MGTEFTNLTNNLKTRFTEITNSLRDRFTELTTNLGNLFEDLKQKLINAFSSFGGFIEWLWNNLTNSFSTLTTNLTSFFGNLGTHINNGFTSVTNWFVGFFDGLKDLFVRIFVPADNFFTNKIDDTKSKVAEKIPYDDYVTIFEDLEEVPNSQTRGSNDNVSMNGYQIGGMTFNMPNFIDLSFITQFKETWYSWVRAFTFIALVIYNINQVIKLLRGYNVAEGVGQVSSSNISGGGQE